MNKYQIVDTWRELVLKHTHNGSCNFQDCAHELFELAKEHERENCALLCESLDPYVYSERTANHCAQVIRSRGHNHIVINTKDLVESMNTMAQALITRAQIREQIPGRKSVVEGTPDRLSIQLREAACLLTQGVEAITRGVN